MKAHMGQAVNHLYTRHIKVPNMGIISLYVMFTMRWSIVVSLQHTKVFQIVGHEPEWITYDRGWDFFFSKISRVNHMVR